MARAGSGRRLMPEPAVHTLGPVGTDADAEARSRFGVVRLHDSFAEAMERAFAEGNLALVSAGFVERDSQGYADTWVNLHFRWNGRLDLVDSWHSPTKLMCLATAVDNVRSAADVRTLALHASTEELAMVASSASRTYFRAKPLAVAAASDGSFDACLGSIDVVQRFPHMRVLETISPKMVWCLYSGERSVLSSANEKELRLELG